jgi:hypothetical protein
MSATWRFVARSTRGPIGGNAYGLLGQLQVAATLRKTSTPACRGRHRTRSGPPVTPSSHLHVSYPYWIGSGHGTTTRTEEWEAH